jgi:hypothetical protein
MLELGAGVTNAETDTQRAEQQLAISNLLCNEWHRFTEDSVWVHGSSYADSLFRYPWS